MAKRSAVYAILISFFILIISLNSAIYGQSNLAKVIKNQTGSGDKIRATFSYSPVVPVTGVPVRFICKTNYTPDTWLWEFGDGTISYEPSPAHDYDNPGVYNVSLTVSLNGSSAKTTKKVRVYAAKATATETKTQELLASFEFSPATPEVGLNVQFTDQSTGGPTSWSWDFGDGSKSTVQNPQHQYSNAGTFNVTLTVSNGTSTKSLTRAITVMTALTPGFNFSPSSPESGEVIQFQDTTSGNPTAWSWNFGDGSTSNLQNPTHSYNSAGSYNVTLQVSNGSYTKSISKNVTVLAPIVVDFSYNPAAPVAGQDVQFINSSTGSITSYSWNFGDGSTSSLKDPVHKFNNAGTYTVTLTASNSRGSKSKNKTITVNLSLSPSFTYTPTSPYAGQSVQFTDTSSGSPTSWQWNFGDGSTSNLKNPSHIYSSAGNYTVTLTVSNGAETKAISKTITVKPVVQADFTYSPANPVVGTSIQFTDKSTGNITSWSWQFGDGATSTQKNPTKTYSAAGSYNVKLTVSDGTTSNSMTQTVTVGAAIVADFSYSPASPTVGQEVQFLDNSQGSPTSWSWDFGDGAMSTAKNPTHTYSQSGTFTVKLTVSNGTSSSLQSKSLTISSSSKRTITAASCSLSDVQAAIAEANPGDIVLVPPGKAMWNSKLVIDKGITLKGAGIDKTIIYNGYSNPDDNDETLILYKPSDYEADWPFRITGFTFNSNDLSDTIILSHNRSSSLTIQTKIRIDHNKFVATSSSVQAIVNNGMRGCVDNNIFYHPYPIRNQSSYGNGETWWNNWEGVRYGKMDNNIYFEDNDFYNVHIVSDCQYANRYVFRYNTINLIDEPYPLFDAHGNQGSDSMYGSFGVEIYGNLVITPTPYFGMRFFDHRGGKALVFMNVVTATSGLFQIKVRDEYPDSLNPETNPDYQFPNDAYYFLNRRNYTGVYNTVDEGEHSDNPPFYSCPTQDRDYFVGIDKFDGSSGVGYGPLSARPSPKKIGVGYWATDQNIFDLRGMVGRSPASPISGTLYKCTSSGEWTAYFTPLTYPHPLRKLLDD